MIEGKAQFSVGNAFYRLQTRIVRDLGVLAATVYKQQTGCLRVLDGMTGCGVRSLRYWLESGATDICANDSNGDLRPILEQNLNEMIMLGLGRVTSQPLNRLLFDCYNRQDYYDLVDIDSFGSPAAYLYSSVLATKIKGLIYLTSTDGRTLTGHLPQQSITLYGAVARAHRAAHEQGLRVIIGNLLQNAANLGLGIEPIFAFFTGDTYRVMVRVLAKPNLTEDNYGFLGYCHFCGEYTTVSWQKLGKISCRVCSFSLTLSGAMWLGYLHHQDYLKQMQTIASEWGWHEVSDLLSLMQLEADFPPYYYTLGEIGRRGKLDIPPRSHLLHALHQQGYRATLTHLNPQALKTTADLAHCIAIARQF